MNREEIIKKIREKRDFSQLPRKDVETAFLLFEKRQTSDEEKIRLAREFLHKVFGAFGSKKLFSVKSLKGKDEEWFLRKHISTRERLSFYDKIYEKSLKSMPNKISIIDLGSGINGFSYKYFKELGFDADYVTVEALGQFVDLMNRYFRKKGFNAKAIHESLFNLDEIKKIIKSKKKPVVVFLFKVIDALEAIERNYSKKLISLVVDLSDRIILSFPTESMIKRKRFHARRTWIIDFLKENFEILEEFTMAGERYIVFRKRKNESV